MNAREIAGRLTAAQRDAVFGKFSYRDYAEQETGEELLYSSGIWRGGRIKRGQSPLTAFGLEVRGLLKGTTDEG